MKYWFTQKENRFAHIKNIGQINSNIGQIDSIKKNMFYTKLPFFENKSRQIVDK